MKKLTLPYKGARPWFITSYFRDKRPGFERPDHAGLDMRYPYATPLVAPADGEVTKIVDLDNFDTYNKETKKGFGVELKIGKDLYSLYWHCLGYFPVKVGDKVKCGQIIAYMGNSGTVWVNGKYVPISLRDSELHPGTHVHWEIYKKENNIKKYFDPVLYINWSSRIKYQPNDYANAAKAVVLRVKNLLGL